MTFTCLFFTKQTFAKNVLETESHLTSRASYAGKRLPNQNNGRAQFQSGNLISIKPNSSEVNSLILLQAQNQPKIEAQKLKSKLSVKVKSNKVLVSTHF